MGAPRLPSLALALWTMSTLSWWAFAFLPLPSEPPAWLAAARSACFGVADTGLPGPEGWTLLVLAPATLLGGIVVLWGAELAASLRGLRRSPAGLALAAALALAVIVEGSWVAAKLRTAGRVAGWDVPAAGASAGLPAGYPRQAAAAPGFALIDQHGATVSLAGLRGRPVVVSFAFAHCRTMCPLVVETLKRAIPDPAAAEVLLVTLDPWRDTVSVLPGVARQWGLLPNFHVLSSRQVDEVLAVVRAYGVPFQRDERSGDVVHPGLVFLIDARGRLAYTFNDPPAAWVREGLDRLG